MESKTQSTAELLKFSEN